VSINNIYWLAAIVGTLLFVVQITLSMSSGDAGDTSASDHADIGHDSDLNGDGHTSWGEAMRYFTMRNVVHFLVGFGWGGVIFSGLGELAGSVLALACGLILVVAMIFMMRTLGRMESHAPQTMAEASGKQIKMHVSAGENGTTLGRGMVVLRGAMTEVQVKSTGRCVRPGEIAIVARVGEGFVEVDPGQ